MERNENGQAIAEYVIITGFVSLALLGVVSGRLLPPGANGRAGPPLAERLRLGLERNMERTFESSLDLTSILAKRSKSDVASRARGRQ